MTTSDQYADKIIDYIFDEFGDGEKAEIYQGNIVWALMSSAWAFYAMARRHEGRPESVDDFVTIARAAGVTATFTGKADNGKSN